MKLALAALAFIMLSIPARADQVWTYTGNSISNDGFGNPLPGANPCGCALDGTITFANPITGLLADDTDPILSFSFTDGAFTFNQTNSTLNLRGGYAGLFESWTLFVSSPNVGYFFSQKYDRGESADTGVGGLYEHGNPGIWSDPVSTPEPATWLLLVTGLTFLLLLGRCIRFGMTGKS